jgi:hypothetical protein
MTKLLTCTLFACGSLALVVGCDNKNPVDPPKPEAAPSQNNTGRLDPANPPSTGPSAADTTNTPAMSTGGLAPATSAPATQPGKGASTGAAGGREGLLGNGIDVGGTGASVPIDIDAGITPPTREEKTGVK